jgi:DNA replication and repair protein RecF
VYLSSLALKDFRSYEELALTLDPGVTVFIGSNGFGKTNIIEAIGYLTTLSSHRVSTDAPLVRIGTESAYLKGVVENLGRSTTIELEINPSRANRGRINQNAQRSTREIIGHIRSVLFAPEDLALVKGDPNERRKFLDILLVLRNPRYASTLSDYERVLKQRNALLKSAAGMRRVDVSALNTLEVWDQQLVAIGSELILARMQLVNSLAEPVARNYEHLAEGHEISLVYQSTIWQNPQNPETVELATVVAAFRTALDAVRKREFERGITLAGPHRDDLLLSLRTHPLKGYASQGESWSYALALKLASYDLLRSDGVEPILILDDVFSELDTTRRDRLSVLISKNEQILITAAVPEDLPAELNGRRVLISRDGDSSSAGGVL